MIISPSAISPYKIPTFQSGGVPFVGLLDLYPSAAAAYSVRRLSSTYAGSAMEVRVDTVGQPVYDIGFNSNGDLDTADLISKAAGNDAFVRTWYDQSGNAINLQNTTPSQQPQVVSSGVILTLFSRPVIQRVDGNSNLLSTLDGNANRWVFGSIKAIPSDVSIIYSGQFNSYLAPLAEDGSVETLNLNCTLNAIYSNGTEIISPTRNLLYDNFVGGGLITIDINDSLFNTLNLGYPGSTSVSMFNNQEFIIYNSNQTDNKSGIESNINTYYSIYSPPSGIGTWAIGTTFIIQ